MAGRNRVKTVHKGDNKRYKLTVLIFILYVCAVIAMKTAAQFSSTMNNYAKGVQK